MILTALTALSYPIVIQYKQGGWRKILKIPGMFVLALNVLANYTELSLIFGFPKKGDWTISARVRKMLTDTSLPPATQNLAWRVQGFLDGFEPDGRH